MAEGGEEIALVADLLSKLFSRRTFQENLDIVKKGRATLKLASLSQVGKGFVSHFTVHELRAVSIAERLRGAALKWIKTYARNTTGQAQLSALALMAIEKDLMELKHKDNLYNRVIELFLSKERKMDFVYK